MALKPLAVYDGVTGKRLAFLQNAHNVQYELAPNALWVASFSLPYSDPKNKYCRSFNEVEIWDQDAGGRPKYIGLFRIMPQTQKTLGTDAVIDYKLEHVLCTLLDDTIHGHREIGNKGVPTERVIGYILENQNFRRWVLKECDYNHEYLYGWQDENLLSALFSVTRPFVETDYYWEFDTRSRPWGLSLKKTKKKPVADIRYRKNLHGLTRIIDPTNLTTRLFCYGYGQADNRLTIAELNGGRAYLDSPNIRKYGIITQVWTDERITVAKTLMEIGAATLKKLEEPKITYEIDLQTIHSAGDLMIGDSVRVVSDGIDEVMVVKKISKEDVTGQPLSGSIELGEGTIDIGDSVAELADRQRIAETYSQGAESIFTDSFVDNADPDHPAEVTFTIPENAVHVNEIRFDMELDHFRAYSRAIYGGGMESLTTEDGNIDVTTTEFATPNLSTTEAATPPAITSGNGGEINNTSVGLGGKTAIATLAGGSVISTQGTSYTIGGGGTHNHGIFNNTPLVTSVSLSGSAKTGYQLSSNSVYWAASGDHTHNISIESHTHEVPIPDHSHSFSVSPHSHSVTFAPHSHQVNSEQLRHSHDISIPSHKHKWSLPNHTHDISYGIYKGPKANRVKIFLDDKHIGDYEGNVSGVNLIEYMSKNANGDVLRGKHKIKIVPDGMTRIECTFLIRLFTNSHGGRQH